ncbi:unnamed protein product [Oppiella nova]|uniref:Uncharacterized protein n=1 Tax=Oppiella nova TaxID=334625 RepID=A0A7R9L9Y0_9ACAR|nr:unnamed protein product [Oppiella nova]CAG2161382.1 unnamed protein product [Oppiella nova]
MNTTIWTINQEYSNDLKVNKISLVADNGREHPDDHQYTAALSFRVNNLTLIARLRKSDEVFDWFEFDGKHTVPINSSSHPFLEKIDYKNMTTSNSYPIVFTSSDTYFETLIQSKDFNNCSLIRYSIEYSNSASKDPDISIM